MNTAAYHLLLADLHTLLHNASVEAGCAARDMHLALTNATLFHQVQKTGEVPLSNMKAMRSLDNTNINALLDLRNQLDIEAQSLERYLSDK